MHASPKQPKSHNEDNNVIANYKSFGKDRNAKRT